MVKSGTVSVTGTVTQITGSTLTAGTWDVTGSKTVHPTLSLSTSFNTLGTKARVTLNGPNNGGQPVFTNLASLADILAGGSLTLAGGVGVTTMGALTNNGLLTLEAGDALTIGGAFAESSTATLTIHLGGSNSVPSFGQIVTLARCPWPGSWCWRKARRTSTTPARRRSSSSRTRERTPRPGRSRAVPRAARSLWAS